MFAGLIGSATKRRGYDRMTSLCLLILGSYLFMVVSHGRVACIDNRIDIPGGSCLDTLLYRVRSPRMKQGKAPGDQRRKTDPDKKS